MFYKDLKLVGNGIDLKKISFPIDWILKSDEHSLNDCFIIYNGTKAPRSKLTLSCKTDISNEVEVINVIPLEKNELTAVEYNQVVDLFYEEVIKPYLKVKPEIRAIGSLTSHSTSLDSISKKALVKLTAFLGKSNYLSQASNEEKWFDFICQTVDDNQTFDYDTLYLFLQDEDYWGKDVSCGKDQADRLAREYVDYVRLLQYYKKTRKVD